MTSRKKIPRRGIETGSARALVLLALLSFAPAAGAPLLEPGFPYMGLTRDAR